MLPCKKGSEREVLTGSPWEARRLRTGARKRGGGYLPHLEAVTRAPEALSLNLLGPLINLTHVRPELLAEIARNEAKSLL
jgi:hypothetical protein